MGGETMKQAYYFSHDSNAHKDPKILKLRAEHGWEGYGIFWAIIETLREQEDFKWKASDKHLLSFCFANGDKVINQVIDTCLEVGLLVNEDGFIHSESLTKRMELKEEIAEKRREAGKKGGSSKKEANAKQNESKESKGKETKVNKKEIDNAFESVWEEYPKKADKQNAYKKFQKKAKVDGIELVLKGTRAYIEETRKHETDQQFIKHYATFLNKESYKDYEQIDPVSPEKSELERV
jgi:flagellar biosynthesis GTPase FlhF